MTKANTECAVHKKIRLAIVAIEKGKPKRIDPKRKLSVAAVAEEADVARNTIYRDHPDLLTRINGGMNKDVRQQRNAKQQELNDYKERNKELRAERDEMKEMNRYLQSMNAKLIEANKQLKIENDRLKAGSNVVSLNRYD